ncbi:hypothetical protein F6P59_09845 [Streptococcus suis]|nr:hypothetical protein [Streptococcus suis]
MTFFTSTQEELCFWLSRFKQSTDFFELALPYFIEVGVRKDSSNRKKEFVNKSLFLVVELKQSIPRLFHSHPCIAQTVWETV